MSPFELNETVILVDNDGLKAQPGAQALVVGKLADHIIEVVWDKRSGLAFSMADGAYGAHRFIRLEPPRSLIIHITKECLECLPPHSVK